MRREGDGGPDPGPAPKKDPRRARGGARGNARPEPLPRALGEGAVAEAPLTEADLQERVGHLAAARDRADERVELGQRSPVVLLLGKDISDEGRLPLPERVAGVRRIEVVED